MTVSAVVMQHKKHRSAVPLGVIEDIFGVIEYVTNELPSIESLRFFVFCSCARLEMRMKSAGCVY